MAPFSVLVAAVLVVSACAVVSAEKPKNYAALYPIGGGVDKYKKFADEICKLQDAASAKNFDEVKKLYLKNKNDANYADSLQAFARQDFSSQSLFGLASKYYDGAGWLDRFFMEALEGNGDFGPTMMGTMDQRVQGVMKTAQSAIALQLVFKELDTAATDLAQGDKDKATKSLDEGYAVFASRPTCGPYIIGDKYADQFGTIKGCEYNTSMANMKIVDSFRNARVATKAGDIAGLKTATANIVAGVIEVHIQAVLNYAKKMSGAADAAKAKVWQTEGYVFYRTIAPFVAQVSPKADAAILKAIETDAPSSTSFTAISNAFNETRSGLKVDAANIGSWIDSPKVTCPKTSAAASVSVKAIAVFSGLVAAVLAIFL